jgi:AcrR family transcriptional regulator
MADGSSVEAMATRPPGRGGPRSAATRRAILAAARARFAAEGFERSTIRAIAADADIDPSMVMRYYGNKEQLFAAAADIDLRLPELATVASDELGLAIARHFVRLWEGPDGEDDALMFLFRSALSNDTAAERLRQVVFEDQVIVHLAAVVPDQAERRAGLVATQLLGVALCRYVLQLAPVVAAVPDQLIADLAPTLQRYLTGPLSP